MRTGRERPRQSALPKIASPLVTLAVVLASLLAARAAQAQAFSLLHVFRSSNGAHPLANLIADSSGNLYGSTYSGGPDGWGEIFKLEPPGTETIVYNFPGHAGGGLPLGNMVRDSAGNIFTAVIGSGKTCSSLYCGMIFKVDAGGQGTTLYEFAGGAAGFYPSGGLVQDSAGNLYGTTLFGGNVGGACGPDGCGVVFKVDPAGNETVLHTFSYTDGTLPGGNLIMDVAGNLYGSAYGGIGLCAASAGCGVVFKVDPAGNETVLHTFTGGSDGALPGAPLLLDASGNLYGVASSGGDTTGACATYGCGVAFKLDPQGNETVLHTFTNSPDGSGPIANLTPDASGNLYGVTADGGNSGGACFAGGCGVVFEISQAGDESVLYSFTGLRDGRFPEAGLTLYSNALVGTTSLAGAVRACGGGGCGVVFKVGLP